MAPNKPTAGKAAGGSRAVSMNPDDFVASGLHSDFDGFVREARTALWNYDNGNGPKVDESGNVVFGSFVKLVVVDKADGQEYIQYYSATYPDAFVPSMDGETPSELDEAGCSEGVFFVPAEGSTKSALGNNTNYAQFLRALRDAGYKEAWQADVRFLEGVSGHWDRVPVEKKGGQVRVTEDADKKNRKNDVLVVTRYDGREAAAGGATGGKPVAGKPAATKPTPVATKPSAPATPSAPTSGGGDLDSKLIPIVQSLLPADGTPIKKASLSGAIMKTKLTPQEKAAGVKRISSNEFLSWGMEQDPALWAFDAEAGDVFAIPE